MAATPVKVIDLNPTPAKTSGSAKAMAGAPTLSQRVKKILHRIFEGHGEYLGMTPD